MACSKFSGLPGVEFDDLLQEGRIAWFKNYDKYRDNPNWQKILYTIVSRAIQETVLPYAFQLPEEIVRVSYVSQDTEELALKLIAHYNIGPKLADQAKRLSENEDAFGETLLTLARKKAQQIIRDAGNMRSITSVEEGGENLLGAD